MRIKKFVIGMIGTNCYVVSNENTKECFIVDPAVCDKNVISYIETEGLSLKAILLTHGHFDHIMGIDGVREKFQVPVYASEKEQEMLQDARLNLSAAYGGGYTFSDATYVRDGEELEIAGMKIKVIETPGHTAGGCCYYIAEEETLFSGDSLFCASIGRTDFPTGSSSQLVRAVRDKLLVLPEDTMVYPGHMEETTIGYERKHNPFI